MRSLFTRLFRNPHRDEPSAPAPAGSGVVTLAGQRIDLAANARWHEGIPHPDWEIVSNVVGAMPASQWQDAALAADRAWLDWLRGWIGLDYRCFESDVALLLTTQPERLAQVKLAYLGTTLRRIERTLEELADHGAAGKELLIAFADEDDYYRYVSGFYPEEGSFAMSAGMHLGWGRPHFVTHGMELEHIEPTIVHEMTHSCVQHLPLPLWLNEGIAQSVEYRFAPRHRNPREQLELMRKQSSFWTLDTIQQFWSGEAFQLPDAHQEMAYALALSITDAFAQDWPGFKAFVSQARRDDAGAGAARKVLGLDLGHYVRLFLEQPDDGDWSPQPQRWGEPGG